MISEKEKITNIIKLSQNENPFGASPLALKAIEENYSEIYRYPNIINETLRNKLAEKYNKLPENIVISAGSVDLVDIIIKAFVGFDDNLVTSNLTFVAYALLAKIHKRECKFAGLLNYTISCDNIFSLCDEKTRVVFIANPNNPTGTMIPGNSLKEFLKTLPSRIFVIIDEAYAEYVTDRSYPDSFELQKTFPNLIILRTFSKIYGLAGMRIGYAIAHPDIIQSLIQHRTPFSINNLANLAASAALDDTDFTRECAIVNQRERNFLYNELKNLGFEAVPSNGNFIFIDCPTVDEKSTILTSLKKEGILARDLELFGTKTGFRISIGRPENNRYLIKCLKQILLYSKK